MSAESQTHEPFQVKCFTNREAVGIPKLIEKAERRVHILTTSLDYPCTFLKESLGIALEKNANKRGFRIVMLTLDPEGHAANDRAGQLGRPLREFRDELREALSDMVKTFGNNRQVDILQYSTLPAQITYTIDETVIYSIVSLGIQSRDGFQFVIENIPEALRSFSTHFGMLRSVSEQVNKRL